MDAAVKYGQRKAIQYGKKKAKDSPANQYLNKVMQGYEGKEVAGGSDPYFAMVEDPRKPGKFKKVKKQIPEYIPEHDAMILARVRKSAYRLDMSLFNLFGIRFGWEAVIGIIPAVGDAIGVALAFLVFRECCKIEGGLPASYQIRMLINIILDFAVGLVPIVGDLVDAAFKCNTRNLRVLEVYLDKKHKPDAAKTDPRNLAGMDANQRAENRKKGRFSMYDLPEATAVDWPSDDEDNIDRHDGAADRHAGFASRPVQPQQPQQAHAPPKDTRQAGRGGGLGWLRGSQQQKQQPPVVQEPPPMAQPSRQEMGTLRSGRRS